MLSHCSLFVLLLTPMWMTSCVFSPSTGAFKNPIFLFL